MRIGDRHYRAIWMDQDSGFIQVIDQRKLPLEIEVVELRSSDDAFEAIDDMVVQGTLLISITAAFGMYLAGLFSDQKNWWPQLKHAAEHLISSKPELAKMKHAVKKLLYGVNMAGSREGMIERLAYMASRMADMEINRCSELGCHCLNLIKSIYERKGKTINILILCRSGLLTCLDYGTATSPFYQACDQEIPIHVWIDETLPENREPGLAAFVNKEHGVPYTVLRHHTGTRLLETGQFDLVLVGSDRRSRRGDILSSIGTYRIAFAANENKVPFYISSLSSAIEYSIDEEPETPIALQDYDVIPAEMVTGLITARGILSATA